MRRKISSETWDQVDVAIAAGIGAREIARNMRLSEGTVLSHVKRKSISQRIRDAKAVVPVEQSDAITPLQSVALTMQQRGQRYAERLGGVVERVVPHLESMEPGEILEYSPEL